MRRSLLLVAALLAAAACKKDKPAALAEAKPRDAAPAPSKEEAAARVVKTLSGQCEEAQRVTPRDAGASSGGDVSGGAKNLESSSN